MEKWITWRGKKYFLIEVSDLGYSGTVRLFTPSEIERGDKRGFKYFNDKKKHKM